MKRLFLPLALLAASTLSALAEPASYSLDPAASSVQFTYVLNNSPANGTMPITQADLVLDFAQVANSSATVTLNASRARTGVIFVTNALKSPEVLNTATYPEIRFVSRRVTAVPGGARLQGDVTIRGVTRPLTLNARIFRREGSSEGDLSRLTILLTGAIDRRDFGATGYPKLVDPTVRLRILARITSDG
ncbi:MAG: YceI family protein [Pseudomonadota bacterium]